jgi:hypothetical protein
MPDEHEDPDDGGGTPSSSKHKANLGVRRPDDAQRTLLTSLVKLDDELADAFKSDPERNDVERERARYVHALTAMSNFLRANNAPLTYTQQLLRLAGALSDLNEGKTDALLKQSTYGSLNAGDTTAEWIGRAHAALGMDVLVAAGETRTKAAEKANKAIGIEANVKTLVNWYDQFRKSPEKSKIQNLLARAIFENGRSLIPRQITPKAAKKLADHFFTRAANQLRKQG